MDVTNKYADELKKVMRQMPFPVTIVTTAKSGLNRGITIGSFTSLSMKPPLISFNVETSSQMHTLLEQTGHFVVNIPHKGQEDLCTRFSIPDMEGDEQFSGISYKLNSYKIPVLDGLVGYIECKKYRQVGAGDHSIFMGEVVDITIRKEDAAVLYLNGVYHQLSSRQ